MQSGQSATCPGMWALQGHSLRCLGSKPAQLKSSGSCWRLQRRPQGLYDGNRWFTPCSMLEQPIPSLKDRKGVNIYYFSRRLLKQKNLNEQNNPRQIFWWMIKGFSTLLTGTFLPSSTIGGFAGFSPGECSRTVEEVKQSRFTYVGGALTHIYTGLPQRAQV